METATRVFTAADWAIWLAKAERRLREVYRLSPERLIAEYRREREITRGYHGREVLELLQNAGDAAREEGSPGRVRVVVTQHGLVMGNTGRPFDKGGVQSLQTANLSPKRQREAVVIGDKGLGFRSILNWTFSPLISSGEMGLAFLPDYAAEIVSGLENQSVDLAQLVAAERRIARDLIVPRLGYPQWIPDWANHVWPDDEGLRSIAAACGTLRSEGFDTAVGMPFSGPQAHEEVVRQVEELKPEFLLLVDSISHLEIQIDGHASKVWTCAQCDQRWTIREGEQEISSWTLSHFNGEVPREVLDQGNETKTGYKITVAVPDAAQPSPGCLFCYFPTEAAMPLPLLVHATVELDETRKHLNDTRANRHILKVLAERIAELAELHASRAGPDAWAGCRLVTPVSAWSGDVERLGFASALHEAAKGRKLVPVLGGGHRVAKEAKRVPGDETKWWPRRVFPEIAAFHRKEERMLAEYLKVEPLPTEEMVQRLLAADDLTLEKRAYAIAGLLQSNHPPTGDNLAGLLCDETETPLPAGVSAILQPTGELPQLPQWATIRFLHPELRRQLGALLGSTESRELQQKLRPFGVVEYSLSALIRPVLAEANRRVHDYNEQEPQIRLEALAFLWRVHQATGGESAFPSSDVTLRLPSQAESWAAPKDLYLGEGYGEEGNVTQDLYARWAKGKLIAGPGKLRLEAEAAELAKFLMWIGVARWPREVVVENIEGDFVSFVRTRLRYPVEFGDYTFKSPAELTGARMTNAKTVDGLTEILRDAVPEAVLAWLTLDPRGATWRRAAPEHGTLQVRPPYKQSDRSYQGPVQSYTHWQIASSPWLPTADGSKKAPRHCLLGDRQLDALFPQPGQPSVILAERYGVSERISECYLRAGVMPGLGQLGRDELYQLLLDVPPLSPDGKASRALCRWFLLNEADLLGYQGESQKRFFCEGRLWGSKADKSCYFKISELRHADFDGLPPALLRNLPIADLPKRVGALKVKTVLGITPLDRASIGQQLVSHRTSPVQGDRSRWFEEAKQGIRSLRQAQTKQTQAVGAFDRLELILCDELFVRMEYEGAIYDHAAREGEWFIFSDKLYVRGDLDDSIDLLADATGVAIASVFGLADGDAFSKILRCEPKNRQKLLKRMCGDDFHVELEAAKATPLPRYSGPIVPPIDSGEGNAGTPGSSPNGQAVPEEDQPGEGQDSATTRTPGVTPIEHVPQPPATSRRLIIRNVRRTAGRPSGRRQLVDGEKCERMAEAFEEQDDPRRFGLGVGHIMGSEAPGFDLVSFDSVEAREVFKDPASRDWTSVRRFIEVKGRSSSTARIELKGNELRAAREYGDRYFLYRIYEEADGHFMVSILQNPLEAEEAKAHFIEVNLERANATQRFEFVVDLAAPTQFESASNTKP